MNYESLYIDGELIGSVKRRYKDSYGWHFVLLDSTDKFQREVVVQLDKIKKFTSCGGLKISTVEKITGEKALEILKVLKASAESFDANEDSCFTDERNMAKYEIREIIDTLLGLEFEDD
jgi:hypothetical protein